ncbi:MAG: tetratricopeptide repeat protein, partial [Pyrinomonadaceae bacterium]
AREPSNIDRAAGGPVNIVALYLKRKIAKDPAFAGVPKAALDAYAKGMQGLEKKDEKKALEQFNKALTEYPDFSQALTEAGAIYIKQKNYDKAIELLKRAVALKPESFDAHFNYGAALYYKPDLPGAEAEFRTAIKLREASAMSHMYLGLIVVKSKKYDEARDELDKAINLPGGANIAQAHFILGGLYYTRDPKRAADELETYLKLQPNAPDAEKTKNTIKELRAKQGTSSGGSN